MSNEYINDFNDTVIQYSKDLIKSDPMSKEEERKLLIKAKEGDIRAQNKILQANLRFVIDVAKKYKGFGVSFDDLICEGNMGMVRAMKKFNLDYNVKFFSYAVWWIKEYMKTAVKKAQKRMTWEKSEHDITPPYNIDMSDDDEDDIISFYDVIMSDKEEQEIKERNTNNKIIVDKLLVKLDDREKLIIESYYGLNGKKEKNLEEIGKDLGVTKERVRQIKFSTLMKLKEELSAANIKDMF